jgi:hypothetical protein
VRGLFQCDGEVRENIRRIVVVERIGVALWVLVLVVVCHMVKLLFAASTDGFCLQTFRFSLNRVKAIG